ncbi:amino acid permease [Dactylosporangium roseum]|uniref:Amino acid permease n=2 Tax=Dactylosporangium roseum TaxID=47989 RepID=A0ABY5ZF17_9ACTN|nr:amino acid permease [Dactylosporangium roseum]UWZ40765.1 amino acid permease [Dactylosporangium roseum]
MIGAGVFAGFAPAARAAGGWLLAALAVAAVVAYCNATSSARLAALYPESGGTYVYGRRRLGDLWGYLAGWGFVIGKTASCAAMALTFGAYAFPGHERVTALAAVAAVTALNLFGVRKSALATRIVVGLVVAVLTAVAVAGVTGPHAPSGGGPEVSGWGVLQAAGLLFFAFAGYARIATLGEEVEEPARTIPRAIPIALGITLVVYTAVAIAALTALGPARLAASTAPLADVVQAAGAGRLAPVVRAGAAVAALGALLTLVLGVSRTVFAMARDRHLPHVLSAVHPGRRNPHRAEAVVGLAVLLLVLFVDLRGAIGFSSFGVLVYYAIANASAFTLESARRLVPVVGLLGCLVLAATLPLPSVLWGLAMFAVGAGVWLIRRRGGARTA